MKATPLGIVSAAFLLMAPPIDADPLVGKFSIHSSTHSGESSSARFTFDVLLNDATGFYAGSVALDFPERTPAAEVDPGGKLLNFSTPLKTHVTFDITWSPPLPAPGSPNNEFAAFVALVSYDELESFLNPHCGEKPPIESGLTSDEPRNFHAEADCEWTSLPFFGSPEAPGVEIATDASLTTFGDSAGLPGGFIGGPEAYVVSSYDFAPPTTDLSVDHLEVVQVVQDASNGIPLIADKPTVVRAFGKFTDTAPTGPAAVAGVTAQLHGFRGSAELAGSPLSPINPDGVFALKNPNSALFDRAATNDALNFSLPSSWTDAGDLTLQVAFNPGRTVGETDYANDTSPRIPVTFRESNLFTLAYLPVCYRDAERCPSNGISAFDAMARKLFPIGDTAFLYSPLKVPRWIWPDTLLDVEDESSFLAFLRRRYALIESQEGRIFDQVLAWLPDLGNGFPYLGSADPKWAGHAGRVSYVQDVSAREAGTPVDSLRVSAIAAHEVAHNLGLRHTDRAKGGSGCGAVDPDSDFAQFYGDGLATIHEVGFDTGTRQAVPTYRKDIMTYCTPASNIWISPFHYTKLISGGFQPQAARALAASDAVIVTGSARRDGSGGTISSIDPVGSSLSADPSDPAGNSCLRFLGPGDAVLADQCFTLTFVAENHGQAEIELSREAFAIQAPFPPGTTKIALRTNGNEVASVSRSAHAPTVAITRPHAQDSWNGAQTMIWNAADADGDALTFTILTSPDGGSTWLPIVTDLKASSYSIDSAELAASSTTLLKVLASDGFDTTAATVGPLTIEAQPFLEAAPELDFGRVSPTGSAELQVLVTNNGSGDGHVLSIASDSPEFIPEPLEPPLVVDPEGERRLPVRFAPESAGKKTATLTIATDDPQHSILTIRLSGVGCAAAGRPCIAVVSAPAPEPTSGH